MIQFFLAAAKLNPCDKTDLIPAWYNGVTDPKTCQVQIDSLSDITKVAGNIVSILLTAGSVLAAIFIIIGGIKYITSQGDPKAIAAAKNTILYAIIGFILTIAAFAIIRFLTTGLS